MEAFRGRSLKVDFGVTKVVVSGGSRKMFCLRIKFTHVGSVA